MRQGTMARLAFEILPSPTELMATRYQRTVKEMETKLGHRRAGNKGQLRFDGKVMRPV